jgi:hypothetical protein
MAFFAVHDTLHGHPTAMDIGLEAMGLWVLAGSYAVSRNTDGFVPTWFVREYGGREAARKLVLFGLWDQEQQGYRFRDWAEREPELRSHSSPKLRLITSEPEPES